MKLRTGHQSDGTSKCRHCGERIEVTTQQLLDQRQLQKLCVEKLNKCPSTMPAAKWETRVNELLTTVEVIQDPDDASPQGQFEKILIHLNKVKSKPDKRMRS